MSLTKGVAAAVFKNSTFRISSVLVSNTLKNSLKSNNNNLLARLGSQTHFNAEGVVTSKPSTRCLSSLTNPRGSFRNSFSTLQSPKKFTFTGTFYSKKDSHLRYNFTSTASKNSTSKTTSEETGVIEGKSMTEKFKILTKKYGVSAIAVYLIISALDLGLTFILVQIGGADRVKKLEDWFKETFGDWIVLRKNSSKEVENNQQDIIIQTSPNNTEKDNIDGNGNKSISWASTLVIAYGIHKLLVPFRLGLTVAITPAIVRKLKRMGWNIGGKHLQNI